MIGPEESPPPGSQFCDDGVAPDPERTLYHRKVRRIDLLSPLAQWVCDGCGLHTDQREPS